MNIKKLIELLQKENQEAEVLIPLMSVGQKYSPLAGFEVAKFLKSDRSDDDVWQGLLVSPDSLMSGDPVIVIWPTDE